MNKARKGATGWGKGHYFPSEGAKGRGGGSGQGKGEEAQEERLGSSTCGREGKKNVLQKNRTRGEQSLLFPGGGGGGDLRKVKGLS